MQTRKVSKEIQPILFSVRCNLFIKKPSKANQTEHSVALFMEHGRCLLLSLKLYNTKISKLFLIQYS